MEAKKVKNRKGSRVKVDKLKLDKDTVKNLSLADVRKIRGGAFDNKGPGGGCNKSARVY